MKKSLSCILAALLLMLTTSAMAAAFNPSGLLALESGDNMTQVAEKMEIERPACTDLCSPCGRTYKLESGGSLLKVYYKDCNEGIQSAMFSTTTMKKSDFDSLIEQLIAKTSFLQVNFGSREDGKQFVLYELSK